MASSLGAFGPLFGSDYVYDAASLGLQLEALGVDFPNSHLQQGSPAAYEQRLY